MQSPKVGAVFRGRYVLEDCLGRGGMGSVWRARDRSLGRPVALKFMHGRLESSRIARKRFEREAQLTAKLQSRHVVRVLDHGIDESTPYIVMELLTGEDLSERLQRKGPLDLEEATRIIGEVCRGLRRAHEAGLVHRDLKPANVFCSTDEHGQEVVKILDFGVVKTMASTFEASVATETGAIVGSVQYASPEQAQGERDLDARSDVWSVAALAFRLITGKLPFPGDALGAVVLAICSRPLPLVSNAASHLPRDLDAVFLRAFDRDKDRRFQTALDFADAFFAAALGIPPEDAAPRSVAVPSLFAETTPAPVGGHLDAFDESGTRVTTPGSTRIVDLTAEALRSVRIEEPGPPALEEGPTQRTEVPAAALAPALTRVMDPPPPVLAPEPASRRTLAIETELATTGGAVDAGPRSIAPLHRDPRRIALIAAAAAAAVLTTVLLASLVVSEPADERSLAHEGSPPSEARTGAATSSAPAVAAPGPTAQPEGDGAVGASAPSASSASAATPAASSGAPRAPRKPAPRCKDKQGRYVPCDPMYTPLLP